MRILHRLIGLMLLALCLSSSSECHAQGFINRELERQLQPGAPVPYNGAGYVERYHFDAGINYFYPRYRYKQFQYIEYLDRVERARKFGYRQPSLPCGLPPSWAEPSHPRVFIRICPIEP